MSPRGDTVPDGAEVSKARHGDAWRADTSPYEGIPTEAAEMLAQAAQAVAKAKAAATMQAEAHKVAKILMLRLRGVYRLSTRRIGVACGLSPERISQLTIELRAEERLGRKLSSKEKRQKNYGGKREKP